MWTSSTQTPSLCDLLHTYTLKCVPFHHRWWHEIRTVWVAFVWNIDRSRDKCGLHLYVIRTNSAQNQVACAEWTMQGLQSAGRTEFKSPVSAAVEALEASLTERQERRSSESWCNSPRLAPVTARRSSRNGHPIPHDMAKAKNQRHKWCTGPDGTWRFAGCANQSSQLRRGSRGLPLRQQFERSVRCCHRSKSDLGRQHVGMTTSATGITTVLPCSSGEQNRKPLGRQDSTGSRDKSKTDQLIIRLQETAQQRLHQSILRHRFSPGRF